MLPYRDTSTIISTKIKLVTAAEILVYTSAISCFIVSKGRQTVYLLFVIMQVQIYDPVMKSYIT